MKSQVLELLKQATKCYAIDPASIRVDFPENPEHGDFTTNLALVNAKTLGMSPKVLADKIVLELQKIIIGNTASIIESVSVAGPGFINFSLKREAIIESIGTDIVSKIGNGQKVLVEYSSPNIAKPFAVAHLRSTIIGDSIANILHALGYTVIRDNHLGDWGTQFGKLNVAIEKWGNIEKIEKSEKPIKELVALYVKFHEEAEKDLTLEDKAREKFNQLERGDADALRIWKICVSLSMKEFEKIYSRLGVSFDPKRGDTQIGESFFVAPERVKPVMDALNSKELLKESEGAKVIFFGSEDEKKWKYPPLIVEKSDGSSIYATRDLAADLYRKQIYGKGLRIINEVGMEQSLYFKQLFETEYMLGWFAPGERVHVAHGLYVFKDGKMSTRKGNIIWLEDLLDEAEKRASIINEGSAKEVALAAIKFNDLKRDSAQNIQFDWDEMMSMTGDSGPYLQYSCVRAISILEKARASGLIADKNAPRADIKSLIDLERYMARCGGVVEQAGISLKPNVVANYLVHLASLFNSLYAHSMIADDKDASSPYKLYITERFVEVMKICLGLLGITVPKKM